MYITSINLQNFKQFGDLVVDRLQESHVIMGPNGFGKTTIMWGLILFFRGYNVLRLLDSSHKGKGNIRMDSSKDLGLLLNYSGLEDLNNHMHFLPKCEFDANKRTVLKATLNGKEFSCMIEVNGTLTITPTPAEVDHKIRFAYMGTETSWSGPSTEMKSNSPIYTSSVPNCRGRYMMLKDDYKVECIFY